MNVVDSRYEFLDVLHSASYAKAYKVLDKNDRKTYELKVYSSDIDKFFIRFFSEKYLNYAKIIHPNILRDYKFDISDSSISGGKRYFYVSEYLDKSKCLSYKNLTPKERLTVLEKLLYALKYLHFRKTPYNNLVFSNINIYRTDEGGINVKLSNLGDVYNSIDSFRTKIYFKVSVVPSEMGNGYLEDLYQLSKITYYLVTGKDYRYDYVDLEADIMPFYPRLYEAMLYCMKSYEYKSDSIDRLWNALVKELRIGNDFWDKSYYEILDFHVDLIGQKEQLFEVEELVDAFYRGTGKVGSVFIKSGVGIGKTRFLRELVNRIGVDGRNPIYCGNEVYEVDKEDYGYFREVLAQLLRKFKLSSDFIDLYGSDIVKIVPEFAEKWNIEASETLSCLENEENRLMHRVIRLILELSKVHNFVIIFDDVDKMNEADLAILYHLLSVSTANRPFCIFSVNDMPKHYEYHRFALAPRVISLSDFNYYYAVEYLQSLLFMETDTVRELFEAIGPVCHGSPENIAGVVDFLVKKHHIYISDKRKFEIDSLALRSMMNLLGSLSEEEQENVGSLSPEALYFANYLAIYSHKFDEAFLAEFFDKSQEFFEPFLKELVQKKVLRKIFNNWGSYYDFFDYRVHGYIYKNIASEEKLMIRRKCNEYYESTGVFDDYEFDSYVLHLMHSERKKEAIEGLVEHSKGKYDEGYYRQSFAYLSFAEVLERDIDNVESKLRIFVEKSKVIREIGDFGELDDMYALIYELSESPDYLSYRMFALINLCDLALTKNKMDEFDFLYMELVVKSENMGKLDLADKYEIEILRLRYLLMINPGEIHEQVQLLVNELEYTKYYKLYYMATLYLAISYCYQENCYKGIEVLKELLAVIDDTKFPRLMITCYEVMFQICHDYLYDDQKAYENLLKAERVVIDHHLEKQNSLLYLNMAKSMSALGNLDDAYEYYLVAEKIAGSGKRLYFLFEVLNVGISLLLSMGNYRLAERKIIRFRELASRADLYVDERQVYYNMVLEATLFYEYRRLDDAVLLLEEIETSGIHYLDDVQKIEYYIIKFRCGYAMKFLGFVHYDVEELKNIQQLAKGPIEKRAFQALVLNLAVHAYALKDMQFYRFVTSMIDETEVSIREEVLDIKRDFIEPLDSLVDLEGNADVKILTKVLLKQSDVATDYLWKLHYILGNFYYSQKKPVEALFLYYEAVNKYWDRIQSIPYESKVYNIENNLLFNNLIADFNDVRKLVYDLNEESAFSLYLTGDSILKQRMLADKRIQNLTGSFYMLLNHIYLPTFGDYVASIADSKEQNILNMIRLFTHLTYSNRGYLVLVDEEGNKSQVFSAMGDELPRDFDFYVSGITKADDFVYIKRDIGNHSDTTVDFSSRYNDKDIMVFPIANREYSGLRINRKYDYFSESKENIIAYVYLESCVALSQINLEKLTEIRTRDGLNALVLNNYNMYIKSSIDKLTGVFNRSVVEKHVGSIVRQVEGTDYSFAVFMVDIDKFKMVNDTYGHRRGDEVLARLGYILKTSVRHTDMVGRYGGEEFILVINNVASDEAYEVADKLRRSVEKAGIMGQDGDLTVSVGLSMYPEHGRGFDDLVKKADRALYESKNNGRNRATMYSKNVVPTRYDTNSIQSVFSEDVAKDPLKVKTILDVSHLLAVDMDMDRKRQKALRQILEVTQGLDIFVLREKGVDICVNAKGVSTSEVSLNQKFRQRLLAQEGGFFVDWGDEGSEGFHELRLVNGEQTNRDWGSYVFSKLRKNGEAFGVLMVRSLVGLKEYTYKDYNYIQGISPLIAILLEG